MRDRAGRLLAVLSVLAAAAACSGPEKRVVDNYFNAVRAQDNQTMSSFAAINFTDPVESWKVLASQDEPPTPATLPQLSAKVKELEAEATSAKKAWDTYKLQRYADLQKVDDIRRKGGAVPAALSSVAAEWDKYNDKSRDLKKQLGVAKADLDKEKRSSRLSVGDVEGLEDLQGEVLSKQVDVEITSKGQARPYVMTLRKYELKREGKERAMSRWIIQDLKPKT